jgi:signal peptidase I
LRCSCDTVTARMSEGPGNADEPGSFDDPDWVEKMLERALDSADEGPTEASDSSPPAVSERVPAPVSEPPPIVGPDPENEPPILADPVAVERPGVSEPISAPEDDDAAWSSWAAGGAPPAAAGTQVPPPTDPTWTQDQTAVLTPAVGAAGTAVVTDPDYQADPDYEEVEAPKPKSKARSIAEWGAVIVGAVVIALLVKTFLFQAFYIPSGSMEPTLEVNDRVLVNKLSYDLHDVNRGDIVVFKRPPEEAGDISDLIKRVVGLPGETITFADGAVYIEGREVSEPYLKEPLSTDSLVESIPNCEGSTASGCTIPEGRVFVMGDNRRDSRDSRFFGPIQESSIVGRAFIRIWPLTSIGFL